MWEETGQAKEERAHRPEGDSNSQGNSAKELSHDAAEVNVEIINPSNIQTPNFA